MIPRRISCRAAAVGAALDMSERLSFGGCHDTLANHPTETSELFTPLPREPHTAPGDRLAGHPLAPRCGADGPDPADGEGPPIVLSEPITADQIDANTPYVIQDACGRAMVVQNGGSGSWEWRISERTAAIGLTYSRCTSRGIRSIRPRR
jgi:hypothetical protein